LAISYFSLALPVQHGGKQYKDYIKIYNHLSYKSIQESYPPIIPNNLAKFVCIDSQ
jgi:hypothetical protein